MIELSKSGMRVYAVCRPGSKIEHHLRLHGIPCLSLPGYKKFSLASLSAIRQMLADHSVDVVHVHVHRDLWMASLAMRGDSFRKLIVSVYMGVNSKNDLLHRWVFRRVDAIVCSSPEMTPRLPDLFPVQREKVHLLPYGRILDKYKVDASHRAAIRTRFGIGEHELLVGTMLRIDPGKGVMDFARSISYLDPSLQSAVRFLIVGEPTRKGRVGRGQSPFEPHCEAYLRQLEAFILEERLSDKILLAGYQDDAIGYLSAMDIFVFPSRDELYSLVMLDAMAMRLPVVAARAGGNLMQIDDGTSGLLYAVGDSHDLAEKLSMYISSPSLRTTHGAAARKFVEIQHDMTQTISQLMNLYNGG